MADLARQAMNFGRHEPRPTSRLLPRRSAYFGVVLDLGQFERFRYREWFCVR